MRLEALQRAMTAAVLGGSPDELRGLLCAAGDSATKRFAIHRNHTQHSLAVALGDNFPVTAMLLGEGFFRQAARRFVMAYPPAEPRLSRYGEAFPRYLAGLEACRSMPFIARVARLESLLLEIADQPVAPAASLKQLLNADPDSPIRLELQPGLRLHWFRYDAGTIWRACRSGQALSPAHGRSGCYPVQLLRNADGVTVSPVTATRYAFRRALSAGLPLDAAGETAGADAETLAEELAALFEEDLVISVQGREPPQ
jgi:Putative DNA-binding domain